MCPNPKSGKKTQAAAIVPNIITARASIMPKAVLFIKRNAIISDSIIIANPTTNDITLITLPKFL